MKKQIISIMKGWVSNNEPIEATADKLINLHETEKLKFAIEQIKLLGLVHNTSLMSERIKELEKQIS